PFWAFNGVNVPEEVEQLSDEVRRLQEITPLYTTPSPVDLAVSSFMANKVELTIPIRDGIHPKCIVYVRHIRGITGAGDYFLEEFDPESLRYSQISFNPGEHYRVVARWPTPIQLDWYNRDRRSSLDDILSLHSMTAEVVVQLRKDVILAKTESTTSPSYPWDQDIEALVGEEKGIFFAGIEQASDSLFT
ncbi:MAG: hypothetical protein FD167_2957, partial [bacterium]